MNDIQTDRTSFSLHDRGWIKSVHEFIESLLNLREEISDRKLWYRGHSDTKYKLLPTIGRKHEYVGNATIFSIEQEEQLLHRFRRRIYPHTGKALKAGEAMFIARHHGLPTRILDWTANALVGLYFACSTKPNKAATLWAIQKFDDSDDIDAFKLSQIENEKDLFNKYPDGNKGVKNKRTEDAIKILHPIYDSPRIVAQDGAFTFHSNPKKAIDSYKTALFVKKNLDICNLYKWRIRSQHKRTCIEQLRGLGITHRTTFPDLDGIAKSLWETEVLWQRK